MAYSDFTLQEVVQRFQLVLEEQHSLFAAVPEVVPGNFFYALLDQCFGQFCLRSRHARPSLLRLRYQRQPQREERHATAPKCAEVSQSNQETTIQVCHASVGAYAHAPWTRHFS